MLYYNLQQLYYNTFAFLSLKSIVTTTSIANVVNGCKWEEEYYNEITIVKTALV